MVCLGNICRSPLAAGILKKRLSDIGSSSVVDSCGFEPYHAGDSVDTRSYDIALKHRIDLSGHTARLFKIEDFDIYDKIFVMDKNNYSDVADMARTKKDLEKVDFIMNITVEKSNKDIPDPYYWEKDGFEKVYQMLDKACDGIIEKYE